ncbi:MAG: DASS family sodium-coupled anion symporter [Verrucomicrobia bacterium]|nr:DASS family sodium-coupled anion symporter [Verrucomicrobiota bacterium]
MPANPETPGHTSQSVPANNQTLLPSWLAWSFILGLGVAIWIWRPAADASPNGWRLLAIFLPCVLALMLQPIAGGAAVLLAVIATVLLGALDLPQALGGYADPNVWLVLSAYFLSRAFIKTGLARRIALLFIRRLGHNTLGLSYALVASNTVLAGVIPSNAARVGGVMLPLARSLAELYKSFPGPTAGWLGCFLMLALYQTDIVACALFFTGQSSNPLAARQAAQLTEHVAGGPVLLTYGNWLWYALAPAVMSLVVIPRLLYRWERPEIHRTPEAAEFARRELELMGSPKRNERVLTALFSAVCLLWIFGGAEMITAVALTGVGLLLLTRILTWEDIVNERAAWDVFIWYGGLIQLGKKLNETGLLGHFAKTVAAQFDGWNWLALFVVVLLVYFYAHYAFASITVHVVSMYPAFVPVLIAAGAPPALVVCVFAFFANFSAGLTHYGTTPGPIIFSIGYVTQRTWWRVGFLLSLVNVAIWLTVGMVWWKITGLW